MKAWLGFTIAVGAAVALTGCSSQSQYPVHFFKRPGPGTFGGTPGSTWRGDQRDDAIRVFTLAETGRPQPRPAMPPDAADPAPGDAERAARGAASQDPSDGGE